MTEPETFVFPGDGAIPNSPLPLVVYRAVVPADPWAIEQVFAANCWPPAWRDGVHPFHHFHANTHEALGVARGQATVLFGGPGGRELTVVAGDVVVVPAGVGHRDISHSPDLLIIGAYPENAPTPDLYRGAPPEYTRVLGKIAAVPAPPADPVHGANGPLTRIWAAPAA